jgi:transcriptional regulator with XRE-family HTH domain
MTTDGRIVLDAATLKELRKKHGLSQEALAQLCFDRHLRVSIASIKRAEAGKPLLYRTAKHLAMYFGVPMMTLAATHLAVSPTAASTLAHAEQNAQAKPDSEVIPS